MMIPELAIALARIFDAYFDWQDLRELADLFSIQLRKLKLTEPSSLSVAKEPTSQLDHGNNRQFLDNVLELAEHRNQNHIANTKYDQREIHHKMTKVIAKARELLESSLAPSDTTVPAGNPFSAKSKVRELLETTTGPIFILDSYIGVGTLDCLRNLTVPIRLVTTRFFYVP
jgi:hypothetical protein